MTTENINKTNTTVNIKELMNLLDKSAIITSLNSNDITNDQILGAAQLKVELQNISAGIPSGMTHSDISDWATAIASAIDGLEEIANKKASWSATPTTTNYPSEKLVKDSLDLKANLTDLPTIDSSLSNTSENPVQNKAVKTALDGKANSSDLGAVATSNSYNDLSNKPDLSVYALSSTVTSSLNSKADSSTVSAIDTRLTALESNEFGIVIKETFAQLPASGKAHTIYYVRNTGSTPNAYDEYTWTGSSYELMGTTAIDLTDYARIDSLDDYIGMEINSNGDISLTFTTPSS